jgi:hypothetical protein
MSDSKVKVLAAVVVELAERIEHLEAELEAAAFDKRNLDAMTAKCCDLEVQNDRLHKDYADLMLNYHNALEKVSELTQELLKSDEG